MQLGNESVRRVELDGSQAVYLFIKKNQGKFTTITYRKRTTNEIRTINGRLGVKKGVKGEGKGIDHALYGLVCISEVIPCRDDKGRYTNDTHCQFRSFGVESVMRIKFRKQDIVIPANY